MCPGLVSQFLQTTPFWKLNVSTLAKKRFFYQLTREEKTSKRCNTLLRTFPVIVSCAFCADRDKKKPEISDLWNAEAWSGGQSKPLSNPATASVAQLQGGGRREGDQLRSLLRHVRPRPLRPGVQGVPGQTTCWTRQGWDRHITHTPISLFFSPDWRW